MLNDELSKIVTFSKFDDIEAFNVMYIFKNLGFEYSGMGGKPTGYKYQKSKDFLKWHKMKPKEYIALLDNMFANYVNNLPTKK